MANYCRECGRDNVYGNKDLVCPGCRAKIKGLTKDQWMGVCQANAIHSLASRLLVEDSAPVRAELSEKLNSFFKLDQPDQDS